MRFPRKTDLRIFRRPSRRRKFSFTLRATAWAAALGYLILALGIPLPLPAGKLTSDAYPCMNHHCGCHSAEECWRHCCCMSLIDKLVWARGNHVTPPTYVLADARYHGIEWERFCAHDHDELALCPCCPCGEHGNSTCSEESHYHESATEQTRQTDWIVFVEALKCRGTDQNWTGLSISLAPPAVSQAASPDNASDSICNISSRYASLSWRPPIPPPRSCAI